MVNYGESVAGLGALQAIWSGSRWLTVTGFVMLVDIAVSLAGLALDPTMITGAPAWMKPLKFGISTSLFCFTVAWMLSHLGRTQRFGAILGGCLAVALTMEIVLIDVQAARHTSSHFNYTTPLDAAIFAAMGLGIVVVFLSTALLLGASFVSQFSDSGLGWAIRLGLLLALLGMGVGPLMTMPTPEQLAAQRVTHGRMPHMGAHTVGAPDGGPGMPVTGWSADHGDLRIAHFLGLHAMQILLLVWWLAARSLGSSTRPVIAAAVSMAGVFAVVLWQALKGLPLFRPDSAVGAGYAAWAAATLLLGLWTITTAQSTLLHLEGK
jgi:hypothetical protein